MATDLYTGTLDVLILQAVSRGPIHGYAVSNWIRDRTDSAILVEEGARCPALHRPGKLGWIDSAGP